MISFITNENLASGRFHSFFAYSLAIAALITGLKYPADNLQPSTWAGGWLVFPNPLHLACKEDVYLVNSLGTILWIVHFIRRLIEVLFVHEYKRGASLMQIIFASTSYVFYGIVVSHTIRFDTFPNITSMGLCLTASAKPFTFDWSLLIGMLIFCFGEAGNAYSHLQLRWAQSTARLDTKTSWSKPQGKQIMSGGLFSYVTCAHFTYEIISWLGYAICTRWAGGPTLVFIWSLGGLMMMADARHRTYKKYFDGSSVDRPLYPSDRAAVIPFVF